MHFREEPVTPVCRHWMCEQVGCNGELLSTGESITKLSTSCRNCGHEDWADATYPRVAHLPIDAIGPDDSYT
jgi:thymidine kinase